MIVLITNCELRTTGGTETVVIELCRRLRLRGHLVMVFSPALGHSAELLIAQKFPVVSNLRDLPYKPDIIHGQHHLETISALLALPETPAIYYIHGAVPWQERVPIHPRILGYINLAEAANFRLGVEKSIPPERCYVLENQINLDLFPSPKTPPMRLQTAAYCPRSKPSPQMWDKIQQLCREHSIVLTHETEWAKSSITDPFAVYARYDLIFGSGRTALEALAAGCVVSTSDAEHLSPLITFKNVAERRQFNLSRALWENETPYADLSKQLANYLPDDQQQVVDFIRSDADSEKGADRLLIIYQKIIDEWKTALRPSFTEEMVAASDYLRSLTPLLRDQEKLEQFRLENAQLRQRSETLKKLVSFLEEYSKNNFLRRLLLRPICQMKKILSA